MKLRELADVEREQILLHLYAHRGNRTHAAKTLGICIRTLRNKLEIYRREALFVIPCQCQFGFWRSQCLDHPGLEGPLFPLPSPETCSTLET